MLKDAIDDVKEGRDALKGTPWGKIAIRFFLVLAVLGFGFRAISFFDEAGTVAQEQFGARALLTKYEWLKETHAQLDKKGADIAVYKASLSAMAEPYKGVLRTAWAREDRDAYNQRATEVAGTIAAYNDLAAQYNAKMAEVNWRFTNVGQLPAGATDPLPREYAPYKTE